MSTKDVALAVLEYYRPFFDRIGEPLIKLKEIFPYTGYKFSRKKFRRNKK